MKKIILSLCLPLLAGPLMAQKAKQDIHENRLLSASNYVAYIAPAEPLTAAPKGYEPFYVSSYARHGSRWLIAPQQYDEVKKVLENAKKAGKLTTLGEDVLDRLLRFYPTTKNRLGELTTVGERQHHGIGKRLTEHFPEVFSGDAKVDGRSTTVIRCILSMEAEMEELAQFNSKITFHNDVSNSLQYYLNQDRNPVVQKAHEKYTPVYQEYIQKLCHPRRLCETIFNDQEYVYNNVNAISFMRLLFDLASNMQSHDTDISFYDLFTEDECYDLWKIENIRWYIGYGPSPISDGLADYSQENLLDNIIATADTIVNNRDYHGATMRFGHEVCVMPLACLLELGNCGKVYTDLETLDNNWRNYEIFPMASNVQLVFYRQKATKKNPNPDGEILVKALLNEKEQTMPVETDNYPYYKWSDLRAYYLKKLTDYRTKYNLTKK